MRGNKLVFGLTIASTLAIVAGCTDEGSVADEAPTGRVAFPLTSGDYDVGVTITLTDDDDATTSFTLTSLPLDPGPLVFTVPPGSYTPTADAWTLEGPDVEDSPATDDEGDDNVTFDGFDPTTVTVTAEATTDVDLLFSVDLDPVVLSVLEDGEASFTATVTADADECDPCAGGDVCATVDGATAECVTPCIPGGDGCEVGEECTATTSGDFAGICTDAGEEIILPP